MSTVKDLSQEILDEKNAKIIPANIKKNVKIFDVVGTLSGTDTTDATATADDIIAPKTAYVNGNKLNGAITPVYTTDDLTNLIVSPNLTKTYWYNMLDYNSKYKLLLQYSSNTRLYLYALNDNYTIKKTYELTVPNTFGRIHVASLSNYYDPDYWYMMIIWQDTDTYDGENYSQILSINKTTGAVKGNALQFMYQKTTFQTSYAGYSYYMDAGYRNNRALIPHSSPNRLGWVFLDLIAFNGTRYSDSQYMYSWDKGLTTNVFGLGLSWHSFGSVSPNQGNGLFTGYFTEDGLFNMYLKWYDSTNGYYYYSQTIDLSENTRVNLFSQTGTSNYKRPLNREYCFDRNNVYKMSDRNTAVGTIQSTIAITESTKVLSSKYITYTSGQTAYICELKNDNIEQVKTQSVGNILMNFSNANDGIAYLLNEDGTSGSNYVNKFIKCIGVNQTDNLVSLQKNNDLFVKVNDVTAIASDVLLNKTFARNDGGIEKGTMPNNGLISITPSKSAQSIPAGYTFGGTVRAVTSSIDSNIQAENIKKDVEILGVLGTYYGPITQEDYDECNELADDIIGGASILPCTELEYIQNTGSQFIDLNYLPSTLSTKYEIGFMRTGIRGYYDPIINCEEDVRFGIVCTRDKDDSQNEGEFWIGSTDSHISVTFPISNDIKYDIIADKTGLSLNGNFYAFSGTIVDANAQWSTLLNHRRKTATTFSNEYSIGKWYYLKIYENDNLIRDYIPALDLSGVACMYEKLGKKFYYNAGTGSFIAGPAKED